MLVRAEDPVLHSKVFLCITSGETEASPVHSLLVPVSECQMPLGNKYHPGKHWSTCDQGIKISLPSFWFLLSEAAGGKPPNGVAEDCRSPPWGGGPGNKENGQKTVCILLSIQQNMFLCTMEHKPIFLSPVRYRNPSSFWNIVDG